ncbi:MAG: sugar ABC transporter permease [Deinococcus sp.]|nr:sugar ABC transporter permease [Deinococcus sp.]
MRRLSVATRTVVGVPPRGWWSRLVRALGPDGRTAWLFLTPALVAYLVFGFYPIILSFILSFTNFSFRHNGLFNPVTGQINTIDWIGFQNYLTILRKATTEVIPTALWTLIFAFVTVALNTVAGVALALILNKKDLRGKWFYRTALILPWAAPSVVTIQVWSGLFESRFGAVNKLLGLLGVAPITWFQDAEWAKLAIFIVNLWLGFPFMMSAALGTLQSIPSELYEAARVDGATGFKQLRHITLPLLGNAFIPIIVSSISYNINNFGVIFLLTGGGPPMRGSDAGGTDILISWAFKVGVQSTAQAYGIGSAVAVVLFFVTMAVSMVNVRFTGALRDR